MTETLTGIYKSTLFSDKKSGYTIFVMRIGKKNERKSVVCKGVIPSFSKDCPIEVEGNFKEKDGRDYFAVQNARNHIDGTEAIIQYMASEVRGIGLKTAEKIVSLFPDDFYEGIKRSDAEDKICSIKRVSREKARAVISVMTQAKETKNLLSILSESGMSINAASRLLKKYGESVEDKLKSDPYSVCRDNGISFYIADAIAKKNGQNAHYRPRVEAILLEALLANETRGNTREGFKDLIADCRHVERQSCYEKKIPDLFFASVAEESEHICVKNEGELYYYRTPAYLAEQNIARQLERLDKTKESLPFKDEYIDLAQEHAKMIIQYEQRDAFSILHSGGVKFLVGGPGRGKTTLVKEFIYIYQKICPKNKILLSAPTGRAAQRMSEVCGMKASTMHKVMEYKPYEGNLPARNADNPLDADFIIVDEFSMVDTYLFSVFLDAVKNGSLLLLVGDKNQLPSVGPGNVMKNLLESKRYETKELTGVFRQSKGSIIIENSDKILNMNLDIDEGKDYRYFEYSSEKELQEKVISVFLSEYDKENMAGCQILTTTKKGLLGTVALNKAVQSHLFNQGGQFRPGDKIIMLRNNYAAEGEKGFGYYNGDMGYVQSVAADGICVLLGNGEDQDRFLIPREDIQDISLAYAITVHKSQGSEYEHVLVVLPKYPDKLLFNNILYTAVTRAKKVTIFSEDMSFYNAILRKQSINRETGLLCKLSSTQGSM